MSNLYLHQFDEEWHRRDNHHRWRYDAKVTRHADDILIQASKKNMPIWKEAKDILTGIGLEVNEEKSQFVHAGDGFDYLGFHFSPKKICYRRNEVWIRRDPTSDLVTPEEIVRLVKGQPPEERSKPEDNVEYARLPRDEHSEAMLKDFRQCVEEIGSCLYETRVGVSLGKLGYVWRYIFLADCTEKFGTWNRISGA